MKFKSILVVIFLLSFSFLSLSQESIEETQKIADELFEDEKYVEATPYYLRLLALEPRDHNFNYRYGACLLHNAGKTQDVFKYLNYAITNPNVNIEANYFLGKAFHFNYQFNDAIKYYKIYQTKAGTKPKASFDVARQIQMCENGKKLITTITEMMVLDKKEIEKEKFFRIYDLNDIGGNLLVTAEFQTKLDEKKNHIPLIHFPENPNVIYYSSYGENGLNGKDIYVQRRLPAGGWGLPQVLKGGVNTKYDEDYPYMHPDGKYLYFSSKGHNSMGGYDVFRCLYDKETDMFGLAENMDFAVSSPNDDLFYVVDSLNANAFFGSNRESTEGKLHVYKVRVDRVPLNMTVIKGEFNSIINPQMKKVWIDVKDYSNGEFVGNFSSNEKGVYLITFPKGGKYEFTIRVGESPQEYKYLASIPFQKEFKPLKQKIIHELMDEVENVKVIDLFNDEVEDPQAVFAKVIKMKSVLTPNVSQSELDRIEKEKRDKEILKELGFDNLSLVEFGYLLDEEVEDARRAERGTKDLENKLYAQVLDYTEEIKKLDGVIQRQLENAEKAENDRKKFKALKYAEKALKNQAELKRMSDKDLAFADSLSKIESSGSPEKTAEVVKYAEGFKALLKENKQKEAYSYLADNKAFFEATIKEKSLDPLQALVERSLELDEEIARFQPIDDNYARDIRNLEAKIEELERSKNGASKKEIEKIDAEIKSKKNEKALIEDEKNFNALGLNKAIEERSKLRRQIDELEAVYTYNTDRIVTKQEAENAYKTANSTDSKGLLSGVLSQLEQLIVSNPNVKAVDYGDLEEELGPIVTNTRQRSEQINNDPNLSAAEKAEKLKALDGELLSSINNELLKAEKSLRNDPSNEALLKKYEALQMAKTLVSTALDLPEDEVGTSPIIAATLRRPSTATNQVNKNVESNNTALNQRPSQPQNNSTNISNTNKTKDEVNTGVSPSANNSNAASNVSNTSAKPSTTAVNAGVNTNNTANNANTSNVNNRNATGVVNNVSADNQSRANTADVAIIPLDEKGKTEFIVSLSPSYASSLNAINSNNQLAEIEKAKEIQKLDEALLASVKSEIAKEESNLKNNPTDNLSRKRLADLKSIQGDLQSDIALRSATIKGNITTPADIAELDARGKKELIETINPFYDDKLAQINANTTLSEEEKNDQKQKLDETLLDAVDNAINKESAKVASNPSDKSAVERLAYLNTVQGDLKRDISYRASILASTNGANGQGDNTNPTNIAGDNNSNGTISTLDARGKSNLINNLNSSYASKTAEIKANSSLSQGEKDKALLALDQQLLATVENKISSEEQKLKSNPTDKAAQQSLSDLKTIQGDLKTEIAALSNLNSVSDVASTVSILDARGKSNLINNLNPSYASKTAEIKANSSLSQGEKDKALLALDQQLLSTVENKISSEEQKIKSNPTDKAAQQSLSDLKTIQGDLKAEIATLGNSSSDDITVRTTTLDAQGKASIINNVNPNYSNQLNAIQSNSSLSEEQKLAELQKLDRALLSKVETELSAKKQSATTTTEKQQVQDLETVKNDLEATIQFRENTISTMSKQLTAQERKTIIDGLSPMYNVKIDGINKNTSLSAADKKAQIKTVNQEFLGTLTKEITALENNISNNPDPQLLKELKDLKSIRNEIENEINGIVVNNNAKEATLLSLEEKATLIESINPFYDNKVKQILANNTLSQEQKNAQIVDQDKKLVEAIDREVKTVNIALEQNPSTALNQKKLADLNSLKAEVESSISSRENQSSASTSSEPSKTEKAKEEMIAKIDPSYAAKVKAIESNSNLFEVEKLTQLQKEDQELLGIIESAIQSTNKDDVSNLSLLNQLKAETQMHLTARESLIAASHEPLDESYKSDLIKTIDSKYQKSVHKINSNNSISINEKMNQLQELDFTLVKEVKEAIVKQESEVAKNPSDKATVDKLGNLEELKREIESDIKKRETVSASNGNVLSEQAKNDLINSFSSTYLKKVKDVKSNDYLLDDEKSEKLQGLDNELIVLLKSEISSLEANVSANKTSSLDERRLEGLKTILSEKEAGISNRSKLISPTKNALLEKSDLIATFDANYKNEVTTINDNVLISQDEKLNQLQAVDEKLLVQIEKELKTATGVAKKKTASEEDIKREGDLEELKQIAENVISERKAQIESVGLNDVSSSDKSSAIKEVRPGYAANVNEIKASNVKQVEKMEALLTEEKALVNDLAIKQTTLEAAIKKSPKDEAAIKKSPKDEALVEALKVVSAALNDSKIKVEDLTAQTITSKVQDINQQALITKVDPSFDTDVKNLLGSSSEDKASKLAAREKLLQENISKQIASNDASNSTNDNLDLIAENQLLNQKIKESKKREESYKNGVVNIGEGEDSKDISTDLSNTTTDVSSLSAVEKLTSPELKKLMSEEASIEAKLNDPSLSKKEKATLEKELAKVQTARMTEQNQLMTDDIAKRQNNNSKLTSQLKGTATTSEMAKATVELATSQSDRLSEEAAALLKQSGKAKKVAAKNELLAQATEKQAEADDVVQAALEQNATSVAIANKVNTLDSKDELIAKREAYENQLDEITAKIEDLDTQISVMKAKKAAPLVAKKENLKSDAALIEKQLDATEELIAQIKETPQTADEKGLEQAITLNEEKEIIVSKEYLEYSVSANKAIRLENQIAENQKMLAVAQAEAKETITKSLVKSNNVSENDVQASVDKVKNIEDKINELTQELVTRQSAANEVLANNQPTADKMKNLLKRGVEPSFNETLALLEQQRAPASGLQISEVPVITYSNENPIPVDVKLPSGLVYRVQVGAFSKPISQDMYNSFSPISGEKISNGITRYMAGFFNNISTVEEAQGQVRSLGYEDAFIVAYCDNERISVSEARRLEASGQCISTSSKDFAIALSNMPSTKPNKVDDLTYNQAPGAAKAIVAESKQGLFFTVQVGVYNKPATSKQLKEINPLVTKRLENGQIRYSTGMFTSVESALPKKADARARGIKDAFVTAYYKGERISLTEASNLLKENGASILEKVDDFIAQVEEVKTPKDEEVTYNKAPGSVPAKAAEAHKGLFFTVQIGVYSKPVTNDALNNVTPLITKKLENGQIRYSSGMFKSIEEAEVKRTDVLQKGVKHAYITAYYEGERITLVEARALLIQHGESILEK
jgi:epidermal growth factor receptor substrate 15